MNKVKLSAAKRILRIAIKTGKFTQTPEKYKIKKGHRSIYKIFEQASVDSRLYENKDIKEFARLVVK